MINMTENQSISKKERMDCVSDHDFLSDLPLSIIHVILGLVPFRDAVRTSILSRQWRHTWASLPHLVFEECCASPYYSLICKFEERLENFITRALVNHTEPILKFKLAVSLFSRCPDIDEWILCLSRNNIKELILDMGLPEHHNSLQVRSSIYSCEKLTNLELGNCKLDPPPSSFKGFLFLKCLCLRDVCMASDQIESLVANCPVLERFDLWDGESKRSRLRISSPNLKYLDLWGNYFELCLSAPLLVEMSVFLGYYGFISKHRQQRSSVCNYTNFMGGFTNLEKLSASVYFTTYLSMGIESCHRISVFHQLKDIELHLVNFKDLRSILVVFHLIHGAPNLEKLKIKITSSIARGDNAPEAPLVVACSDDRFGPNFKLEKLRVVEMDGLTGLPSQMLFIKFLLERSAVLETMSFGGLSREEEQSLSAQLQGCDLASSPNAKLVMTTYNLAAKPGLHDQALTRT